jgi:hypothetical protein
MLNVIRSYRGNDWDTLDDIEGLGLSGYFVSKASNIEKHLVVKINKGKMDEHDAIGIFVAYNGASNGSFFDNYESARRYADVAEQYNDEEEIDYDDPTSPDYISEEERDADDAQEFADYEAQSIKNFYN